MSEYLPFDDVDRDFLLQGICYGFQIVDVAEGECIDPIQVANYRSCQLYHSQVEQYIKHKIECNKYLITDEKPCIISALCAIPKSNSKIILIHDASLPVGKLLNDYVTSDCSCAYMVIREAVKHVSPGCVLAKIELSATYRSVNIHPSYAVTGWKWTF